MKPKADKGGNGCLWFFAAVVIINSGILGYIGSMIREHTVLAGIIFGCFVFLICFWKFCQYFFIQRKKLEADIREAVELAQASTIIKLQEEITRLKTHIDRVGIGEPPQLPATFNVAGTLSTPGTTTFAPVEQLPPPKPDPAKHAGYTPPYTLQWDAVGDIRREEEYTRIQAAAAEEERQQEAAREEMRQAELESHLEDEGKRWADNHLPVDFVSSQRPDGPVSLRAKEPSLEDKTRYLIGRIFEEGGEAVVGNGEHRQRIKVTQTRDEKGRKLNRVDITNLPPKERCIYEIGLTGMHPPGHCPKCGFYFD